MTISMPARRRKSSVATFRFGILCFQLFFIAVLLLGARSLDLVMPLGACLGLATGFYWQGWNMLLVELGQGRTWLEAH